MKLYNCDRCYHRKPTPLFQMKLLLVLFLVTVSTGATDAAYKTLWYPIRGNTDIVYYCPIGSSIPSGYYPAEVGDCARMQGGMSSGVTGIIARKIQPWYKSLCVVRRSDMPPDWRMVLDPWGKPRLCLSGKYLFKKI
ncbi:hypothetical protein TetV_408 [Tetraselmis virus 1]|uniref:Uncharacterized protein n=1 Tax=Tetraselmis virus 1 TaxID=2060617 RepID=A0A2P0VNP0_9VIRU|nr:hypothetical protein QJ968_gp646 [Tetraselmis virus 1]AUF82490.1 hypothetical protein TetV_408 [Tetraselmis virus 1]